MALIDRILGLEMPKIAVHQFSAALVEYKRGVMPSSKIISDFFLTPAEVTQLSNFLTNLDTDVITRDEIEDVLILGEGGYYTRSQVLSRLSL